MNAHRFHVEGPHRETLLTTDDADAADTAARSTTARLPISVHVIDTRSGRPVYPYTRYFGGRRLAH